MNEAKLYDFVFGPESVGETEEERAASSRRIFVRSQLQVAEDNPEATGHRLTAYEVWRTFGLDALRRIAEEGSCPIIQKTGEPSRTLKTRRGDLNLQTRPVANAAGVSEDYVKRAETPGEVLQFQILQRIGQALALDERALGFVPGARGDRVLGVRLREMAQASDAKRFSEHEVTGLAEAAWIIARQMDLSEANGEPKGIYSQFVHSQDYSYPAYKKGYDLALTTRKKLSIPDDAPIDSMKSFIEHRLGIPVIQLSLGDNFAGATVANNTSRGIVVNEKGANANV